MGEKQSQFSGTYHGIAAPRNGARKDREERKARLLRPPQYLHHLTQTFTRLQFDRVVGSLEWG